jgi:hypothetical protein
VCTFSTIAESLVNNQLLLSSLAWTPAGTSAVTILITAVDNDVPSNVLGATPPTGGVQCVQRKLLRKQLFDSAKHASEYAADIAAVRSAQFELRAEVEAFKLMVSSNSAFSPPAQSSLTREESEESDGMDTPPVKPSAAIAAIQNQSSLSDSMIGSMLRKALSPTLGV